MSGFRIANPKLYALLDKSRTGNPGTHSLKDPDAPARTEASPEPAPAPMPEGIDIAFRCGHTGLMPAHITHAAAPAYGIWASSNQDCTPCYLDSKASTAALDGEAQGLPALLGSYKQVRWALTIRRERIEEVKTSRAIRPLAACTERALDKRLALADARWWIGTRDISLTLFASATLPSRKART